MNINQTRRTATSVALAIACMSILMSCGREAGGAVCTATNEAIDQEIVAFALNDVEGKAIDTSAIQQGARETQNLSHLTTMNANLNVLAHNGCPPRTSPIKPSSYVLAASECYKASSAVNTAAYGDSEKEKTAAVGKMKTACAFSRWKEDGGASR